MKMKSLLSSLACGAVMCLAAPAGFGGGHHFVAGSFAQGSAVQRKVAAILNTVFVEANHLLEAPQTTIQDAGAEGVGGEVKLRVGRLPAVQVGPFTMSDPVLHFAQDRKGAFGSSEFSGVPVRRSRSS